MSVGRPRDQAPEGYLTIREAAEILEITDQAIRNRIKRGTLPSREVVHGENETRRYIPKESIQRALQEKTLPATRSDTDEMVHLMESLAQRMLAQIVGEVVENRDTLRDAILSQEKKVTGAIDNQRRQVTERLDLLVEDMHRAIEIMQQAAQREKELQERMLKLFEIQAEQRIWWEKWQQAEERRQGFTATPEDVEEEPDVIEESSPEQKPVSQRRNWLHRFFFGE
jgi:hypothetical protein